MDTFEAVQRFNQEIRSAISELEYLFIGGTQDLRLSNLYVALRNIKRMEKSTKLSTTLMEVLESYTYENEQKVLEMKKENKQEI